MDDSRTAEICRRMNEVRCNLGDEVEGIADSARTLTDWRYYMRTCPWLCLSGALAIGFLVVPRRAKIVPNAEVLERLVREREVPLPSRPSVARSLVGAGVSFLASAAARGALGYVAQHAGKLFETSTSDLRGNDEESDYRRAAGRRPPG